MYLNCHTYYSFRYGTFSEQELLHLALKNKQKTLALTDINNTSACLNFIRLAVENNIKPVVGIDFREGAKQHYVTLAQNNQGFLELNRFLSVHLHAKTKIPVRAPQFKNAFVIYPFEELLQLDKYELATNEYIGVRITDLRKIRFSRLYKQQEKMVLLHPVTFRNKKDFNIHRLLRAVSCNTLLSKLQHEEQGALHHVMNPSLLLQEFKAFPFILSNTEKLLDACCISFDFSKNRKPQNKKTYTGSLRNDKLLIKKLCREGLTYRYPKLTTEIENRLKKELQLIEKMEFISFFLVNHDIVSYARNQGFYHVGRGSGANSIVAYLLRITDVDPLDLDLYFERFMNLYRANPPDFDIDFSWRDRENVTRYIFNRFGAEGQVALLATYSTFKHSAAVRELGKVFGLPKHEIDVLSNGKKKSFYQTPKNDSLTKYVLQYANYLQGFPNHLSIHAGGILISERPINYFSATDIPPKGFPTTQFDMVIAEDVGLYKYDILAQRGLGKIKDAQSIIKQNQPQAPAIDIHNVKAFFADPKINGLIRQADCVGCFYVESPAMRMLLKKLEVDNYLGLVAASSIIRPGVAKSGMMREYILRHKNPERRKQAHKVMWQLMADTYGVMVYQEDVIKVAHHYAGLSLGEADVLRRGMSGKFRSRQEFKRVQEKFICNCREKGEPDEVIFEIWRQIESFAGYAFAKGHSASYAVESYQSLFLKAYYPLEYMVACLNNGGGFYRPEIYVHEARNAGAMVFAPCVNKSQVLTTIYGKTIYLGLHMVWGLENKLIANIVSEREKQGTYTGLNDFLERIPAGIESVDRLIRVGAFAFTTKDKRSLLWQAHYKLQKQSKRFTQSRLFTIRPKNIKLPTFKVTAAEDAFDQIELLGFALENPFSLLQTQPANKLLARDLAANVGNTITLYGYLVTIKNTNTSKGQNMNFGTFLDQKGEWIDTVHFPPVAAKYPFRGKGVYALTGKVVSEFGFLSLEIIKMQKQAVIPDPRYNDSQMGQPEDLANFD